MNLWDGTHLFVWQASSVCDGQAEAMIEAAKKLGVHGVVFKFADGSLNGDVNSQKFMDDFKRLVGPFKEAGFVVGGWMYQYLTDPDGEVAACVEAIEAGADWIVIDGEKEVEGKGAQVTAFGAALRSKYPTYPIGFSSFALTFYHNAVPFAQYAAFCDVLMPQIYWADMGWDVTVAFEKSVESWSSFGKPLAPTGQAYQNSTSPQMARFVQLCKTAGFTGITWWDWQHCNDDHLAGITGNILAKPKPKVVLDHEMAEQVIVQLGHMWQTAEAPQQVAFQYTANAIRSNIGEPLPSPSSLPTKDAAQKVVDWLGSCWQMAATDAAKAVYHFAADALREAASLDAN